jgi:hypothetical protein
MRTIATRGMHRTMANAEERMMRILMPKTSAFDPRGLGVEPVRRPRIVPALTYTLAEVASRA